MTDPVTHAGDRAGQVRMNVGDLPIRELLSMTDSALHVQIQRVLEDIDRPGENYAAFGSTP